MCLKIYHNRDFTVIDHTLIQLDLTPWMQCDILKWNSIQISTICSMQRRFHNITSTETLPDTTYPYAGNTLVNTQASELSSRHPYLSKAFQPKCIAIERKQLLMGIFRKPETNRDMHCTTHLHPDFIFPVLIPESTSRSYHDLSFETGWNHLTESVPKLTWQTAPTE